MKRSKRWFSGLLTVLLLVSMGTGLRVSALSGVGSEQQRFIDSISSSAVSIARARGLFPSVMIAQAILESDWGRSKLSQPPYYNLFGIKGGSDGVVFNTLEDDGTGTYYAIKDSFRRYNSYLESLQDYAALFTSTPYLTRVYANFVNATTVEQACQALTGTYATDTQYASKLMNIIIGYNLLIYDGEVNKGPSWAIEPKNDTVYCMYNQVNIRADHSTASSILGRAQYGQAFHRKGVTTGWTQIELQDGRTAYMASEYLSPVRPTDADADGEADYLGDSGSSSPSKPEVTPTEPPPTEPAQPEGPTEEEIEAARAAADQAISEGPTSGNQEGLLDTRTVGVANENPVDKSVLETFLGSNVDLPFTSDTLKAEYREKLQAAVNLYWSPKATQEEIDQLVETLRSLQQQAEKEDAEGLKADNEQIRTVQDAVTHVQLRYTKLQVESTPQLAVGQTSRPSIQPTALKKLQSRGQRMHCYEVLVKDEKGADLHAKENLELLLPIPEILRGGKVELYSLNEQGNLIPVSATEKQGAFVVHTRQFGKFILVQRNIRLEQAREQRAVYANNQEGWLATKRPEVVSRYGWELLILLLLFSGTQAGLAWKRWRQKTS